MRFTSFIILFLSLILNVQLSYSQSGLNTSFNKFLADSKMKYASASIFVADAETGDSIFANKQIHLVPASVMKLVTSAAALELLGPEMQFETLIETTGELDSVAGILNGNLIIRGSGDPTMKSEYFNNQDVFTEIVQILKRSGVESINGSVIVDATCYTGQPIPRTWIWEDMGNYYGAGAYGVSLYDNYYKIHFKSGHAGTATKVSYTSPALKELDLVNQVKSSSINRDLAYVFAAPGQSTQTVTGTIPANRKDFAVKAAIPNPPLTFAALAFGKINKSGIKIADGYKAELVNDEFQDQEHCNLIGKVESPALKDIIYELNHNSVNLFAEALAKKIGLQLKQDGSTATGTEAIVDFWDKLNCNGFMLADGSGLSRFNAISPRQLTNILIHMNRDSKNKEVFIKSLPIAGTNGTMVFYRSPELKGNLLAKTGSMTGVRSFAGYMKTASGRKIAFTFIVNHFKGSSFGMAQKMEKFLVDVYKEY